MSNETFTFMFYYLITARHRCGVWSVPSRILSSTRTRVPIKMLLHILSRPDRARSFWPGSIWSSPSAELARAFAKLFAEKMKFATDVVQRVLHSFASAESTFHNFLHVLLSSWCEWDVCRSVSVEFYLASVAVALWGPRNTFIILLTL